MATLSNPRGVVVTVAVLVLLGLVGGGALLWRQSVDPPTVRVTHPPRLLGRGTSLELQLQAARGHLSTVRIDLEQGDDRFELFHSDSLHVAEATLSAELRLDGVREGEARLFVHAGDDFWRPRGQSDRPQVELPVLVDLTPPPLQVLGATRYPEPGGAALAVVSTSGAESCWIEVGPQRFLAHPRGDSGVHVALYAIPLEWESSQTPTAVAVDAAGNRSEATLPVVLRPRAIATGQVDLSESWLLRELPPLLGKDVDAVKADVAAAFQEVSVGLRAAAAERRSELAAGSGDTALWQGAFRQLPNSSVLSRYGVKRTYRLDGRRLDEKIHQGLDLASVRHARIPAANDGRVVHAGPLTIYGNAVIVDHGLGLLTLYGHCSSVAVAVGDFVERGQTLGMTGATGLAVGDHLHFEVIVGGVPVTPIQWLDGSWIDSHIEAVAREAGVRLHGGA